MASKLFKNSLDNLPDSEIYTWSDNRLSNGDLYNLLGFSFVRESAEDYSYIQIPNPRERIPKQKMKKSKINYPKEVTEKDFLSKLGYARIWGCG